MAGKEEFIAYCGLYCEECFSYKGVIADMARDLRKELRQTRFDKAVEGIPFKEFQHYDECYEVLGAMVRLRCKSACRNGGGNPFCNIRKCCEKKISKDAGSVMNLKTVKNWILWSLGMGMPILKI